MSTNHNLSEEKGEPKRYRTEVLPLTNLTPYRSAKPAHGGSVLNNFALRPQKRSVLLGTGTGEGGGNERVKALPRIPPEKDRRDRGPPPE